MNFAEKLFTLRTQSGYSQEVLAEKLSVSRQAVSKWETGPTLPETDKLIAISNLFNVSIDSLLIDSINLNTFESMDRILVKFLSSARDMDDISEELLDIMEDGTIDSSEKIKVDEIIKTLDSVARIIDEIKRKMNM